MTSHDDAALALLEEVAGGKVTIVKGPVGRRRDPRAHELYGDARLYYEPDRDATAALLAGAVVCGGLLALCVGFWAMVVVAAW